MTTNTLERLNWIASQLDNLNNGGNIRYEGNTTYQGARAELADVIAHFVDHSETPAPVVLQAMTESQVVDALTPLMAGALADMSNGIVTAVGEHIEASDVAVMSAIATSQGDIINALTPAA